jgi:hypothetical protein
MFHRALHSVPRQDDELRPEAWIIRVARAAKVIEISVGVRFRAKLHAVVGVGATLPGVVEVRQVNGVPVPFGRHRERVGPSRRSRRQVRPTKPVKISVGA